MKSLSFAVLAACGLTFGATAHAKEVVVKNSWDVARPVADVVRTLAAYDQYCARGCRYRVPSVVSAEILSYGRHEDDFYTWTSVKDVKDSTWFSHFSVRRGEGHVRVEVRMVTPEVGETLERTTQKEHEPLVDAQVNVYELEELREGDHVRKTRVTLTATVVISGVSAVIGSGIVRDRLQESAKAMRENLLRPPPPAR